MSTDPEPTHTTTTGVCNNGPWPPGKYAATGSAHWCVRPSGHDGLHSDGDVKWAPNLVSTQAEPIPFGGYERQRLADIIDHLRTERDNHAAEVERLRDMTSALIIEATEPRSADLKHYLAAKRAEIAEAAKDAAMPVHFEPGTTDGLNREDISTLVVALRDPASVIATIDRLRRERDAAVKAHDEAEQRWRREQARADQWQDHCKQGIAELAALCAELSRIVTLSKQCYVSRLDLTDMIRQALAGQATQPAESHADAPEGP